MITKFSQLYEKANLADIEINIENKKDDLIKKLIDELSLVIFKRKGNHKTVRITKLDGGFEKYGKNLIYTDITINLSNGDTINGKLSDEKDTKNIEIEINDEKVFDIPSSKFNNEKLIDKIIDEYRKHIQKSWKIR